MTLRVLLVSMLFVAPVSLAGQRLTPVPAYAVGTLPPLAHTAHFAADSIVPKISRTYWLEGGIVGGVSLGILSMMIFRGMRESTEENVAGDVAGFVLGATVGFPAGALLGGQIRKSDQRSE